MVGRGEAYALDEPGMVKVAVPPTPYDGSGVPASVHLETDSWGVCDEVTYTLPSGPSTMPPT